MSKIVVYIAGPYRAASTWKIECNIAQAKAAALAVWQTERAVAYCPHANTAHFDGEAPDQVWLDGNLEILSRCDAVLLVGMWQESAGTLREVKLADEMSIPVFHTLDSLLEWLT